MWLPTAFLGAALASGQTTHVWTALSAVDRLPSGPVRDLLSDPAVHGALVSGTMFPDGGYSPFVNHDYGETAHWEPFQMAYANWIVTTWPDPDSEEARLHTAFLFGLVAHGIGDQFFDAAYLERSKAIEPWNSSGADTATDVVFASLVGGFPPNEHWVPYEDLVPLFAEVGVEVDVETMATGMSSLDLAIAFVGSSGADPSVVEQYAAQYPWASSHLLDATVPGSPQQMPDVISVYWLRWWERMRGSWADEDFFVGASPANGSYGFPAGAEGYANLVSIVLGKAVDENTIESEVTATSENKPIEISSNMYYGQWTNVLNVAPVQGWPIDAEVSIEVPGEVVTIDGWTSEPLVLAFSTGFPDAVADLPVGCNSAVSGAGFWGFGLFFGLRRRR